MRRFNISALLLIFSIMLVYGCSSIDSLQKSSDNSGSVIPVEEKVTVWFDAQSQ